MNWHDCLPAGRGWTLTGFKAVLAALALLMPAMAPAQTAAPAAADRAWRAYYNGKYDQSRLIAAPLCSRGDQNACSLIALMQANGRSGPAEPAKGFALAQKLCSSGSAAGCSSQGVLTFDGSGTAKDSAAAYRLVEQGCSMGDARGCQQQAAALFHGTGVPMDRELAARLYLRACDKGHGKACNELGWFYLDGTVFPKSHDRALALYQRGCSLEYADACRSVGYMYFYGLGVDRNYPRAIRLYQQACTAGAAKGCTDLDKARQVVAASPAPVGKATPGIGPTARQIRDALVYENTYGVVTGADALGLAQRQANYETGLSRTTMFGLTLDVQFQVSSPACQAKRSGEFVCDYDYRATSMGITNGARATHTFVRNGDRWRSPTFQAAMIESARRNAARRSSERNCTVQGFGTLEGPHLADAQGLRC